MNSRAKQRLNKGVGNTIYLLIHVIYLRLHCRDQSLRKQDQLHAQGLDPFPVFQGNLALLFT